tara:strand:- start:188 stop:691 length:504 start_codon:yes stop_codon:yes gene_type:complete
MSSSQSHKIKSRDAPRDIFITPPLLAKLNIDMIEWREGEIWLDSCKNNGSYYNQFPKECPKEYCEILEGKDFFEYDGEPDIIIQNPPYSNLDEWIKKNIELNPRIISLLIGVNNLTTRRLEWLYEAGYGLVKMRMLKVWRWFGMSYILIFERGKPSVLDIDRKIWRA